ncbi:MAG TPA: protein kinase [Thermoanaerobaculia bacterium]|nr:protein kinase [Thermoanaerobaculia bacterium]
MTEAPRLAPNRRFGRLRAAFDGILDLAEGEREAAIRQASGGDPSFEAELRALLASAECPTTPFDRPPLRALGGRLAEPPSPDSAGTSEGAGAADPAESAEGGAGGEAPEPIAGYRILQPIGRGGSATVYLAEQLGDGFTRPVALKVIGRWVDSTVLRRFRAEQRILAALEHPGIARLYDAGITPSGRPFLAMELVRGTTILDHCARIETPLRARIELFLSVLAAVEHAHASSVVHRDLKPGNVLVSERGEPKLLDFGIARLLEAGGGPGAEAEATQTQQRAMTPSYASPEQVRGEAVERASDIYSLGVVLYELLTGRKPYKLGNTSLAALERAIHEREPDPPGLGRDLDAILGKALRKEPAARYASAAAFADDLRRFLDGRPVLARRGSLLYRLGKEARRKRGLWLNVALAALLLAGLAVWLSGGLSGRSPRPVDPNASPWLAIPVAPAAQESYRRGLDALARSETTAAIASLRSAAARDPEQPLIHAALATAQSRAGHDALARAEGQQALHLATRVSRESRLLIEAVAYRTAGQLAEELKLRRALWLLEPGNFEVGFLLAASLVESGAPEEALAVTAKLRALPAGHKPAAADLRLRVVDLEALILLGRPQEVAERAGPVVARAKARGLPLLAARALLQESQAQDGLGRSAASRALAEEARRLFTRRGEMAGVARSLNLLCLAQFRESRHDEAERLCGEGARLYRRVGSATGVARALSILGASRQRRGLIREARATFAQALDIEDHGIVGDRLSKARYLHNLANLDGELGHLREAEDGLRKAIAILRDAGNELSLMRGLNALSVVLQKRGALGEAGALADEATRLARQVGSPRELANLLWLQGGLATIRGETGRARDWYDQAERQLAEVREEGLLAVFVADRKQLAEPSVRTCRELESSERELERLGDRAATEITVDVSRCWSEAGSPRDAKRWLDLAEKTATASQLPEDRIELDLARAAVALGAHRWPEAERTLAAAASQCRNDSLGTLLMETRLLQTRLSLARGDHPERVRTLAEELREDALAGSFGKVAREVDEILRAPRLARPALTPTLSQSPAQPPGEGTTPRAAREPTHP